MARTRPRARSARALLGGAELLGHRLEHRPGELRVRLDERAEVPHRHPPGLDGRLGGDRGRAAALGDQRDLAEIVAWAELAAVFPANGHLRAAVLDNEEADAALALGGERRALVEPPLLHRPGDLLELAPAQVGEERDV